MTAPQDLHDRIDRLPSESLERIAAAVVREEQVQQHFAALQVFQADWTPEEQAVWDESTKRRPSRTEASS